mmetsp:Transcript_20158/g.37497  ORF Transcript_20158/g.37497 Transcript_20158/m.37497 type:complete len:165 (+) Transcript_20158:66-560(+)
MSVTLMTSHGPLKIQIFWEDVPVAAKNFLALAASGYYDGCKFHRNIPGFMVQGGDPSGTGKNGESIYGEPFDNEIREHLKHSERGMVSMANGGPKTNGSQFFITYGRQQHLNGSFTVFGKVVDGFDTLTAIEETPNISGTSTPAHDIVINSIVFHSNPIAELES